MVTAIALVLGLAAVAGVGVLAIESLQYVLRLSEQIRQRYDDERATPPASEGSTIPGVQASSSSGPALDLSSWPSGQPILLLVTEDGCVSASDALQQLRRWLAPARGRCAVIAVGRRWPRALDDLPEWISVVHDEHRRCQRIWALEDLPALMVVDGAGVVARRAVAPDPIGAKLEEMWSLLASSSTMSRSTVEVVSPR